MARARAEAPAPRQLALGCAWAWGHGALRRAWRAWSRGQAGGGRAFPLASVRVRRGVRGDEQDCSSVSAGGINFLRPRLGDALRVGGRLWLGDALRVVSRLALSRRQPPSLGHEHEESEERHHAPRHPTFPTVSVSFRPRGGISRRLSRFEPSRLNPPVAQLLPLAWSEETVNWRGYLADNQGKLNVSKATARARHLIDCP